MTEVAARIISRCAGFEVDGVAAVVREVVDGLMLLVRGVGEVARGREVEGVVARGGIDEEGVVARGGIEGELRPARAISPDIPLMPAPGAGEPSAGEFRFVSNDVLF